MAQPGQSAKKSGWNLKAETREFCEKKGKDIPEFSDEDWMADFAFAVDVTAPMNELNTKLPFRSWNAQPGEGFHEKVAVSFKPTGEQHSHSHANPERSHTIS